MNDEYDPTASMDEGEWRSEDGQDARIESEFRYDPFKKLDTENRRRRMDTDTEVAKQLEAERNVQARVRRTAFRVVPETNETSFDRIREGRSAT